MAPITTSSARFMAKFRMPFPGGNNDVAIGLAYDLAVIEFHGARAVAIENQLMVIDDPGRSTETRAAGTMRRVRLNDVVPIRAAQDRGNLHEPSGRGVLLHEDPGRSFAGLYVIS